MSRFQSLSAWFRRLSLRERRVVAAGGLVSVVALLLAWVALPFAHRWQDREAAIGAKQSQLGRLRALTEGEAISRQALATRQRERGALRQRLLTGATPALAASSLQALLQDYADQSRVTLDRVDLVAEPGVVAEGGLPAIPVQLSAQGDIYGLADLLARLQYGGKLLVIDELRVNAGQADGDGGPEFLTWSVRLHGAYSPE
jgi:type II secretory pathway component PulM